MSKLKATFAALLLLAAGTVIGGYLFSESQPRSFLSLNQCQDCLSSKDLAGLLVSVGVNKLPGVRPPRRQLKFRFIPERSARSASAFP